MNGVKDMRHLSKLIALSLLFISQGSCAGEEEGLPVEPSGPVCGPCDMTMPEDFPLTQIGGMKFAVCGGRCEELISSDPERYSEFAVGE